MRQKLENVEKILAEHGESGFSQVIRQALNGSDQDLQEFLVSNELWGGPGSVADQAGVSLGRDVRRQIEMTLVELGLEQMRKSVVNDRTKTWVNAFRKWREGI
ncbi:MAG: hypothetical protein ABIK28_00275 [Planctomycetota bacterium]